MKFLTIEDTQVAEKFQEFYEGCALTFEGMVPEEAKLYVDFFRNITTVDDSVDGYIVRGAQMNREYHLHGTNAYSDDLNILVLPLEMFASVSRIAIPRMEIGGRWFSDIVDNNARREGREEDA